MLSLRTLLRHPIQFAIMTLGIALGVAVMVGIDIANASAAFPEGVSALNLVYSTVIGDFTRTAFLEALQQVTLATVATSSLGSTGFDTCTRNPACNARVRSSDRANAVSAMAGVRRPRASSTCRARRRNS